MRINILIQVKKAELPKDNRQYFLSYIKKAMNNSCHELYLETYASETPLMKKICFSLKFNNPKFSEDKIYLGGNEITMSISTSDMVMGIELYNAILNMKSYVFPICDDNCMTTLNVGIENAKLINKREINIYMLSPLVLRFHNKDTADRYYIFEDAEFQDCFYEVTKYQLSKLYGISIDKQDIKIEAIRPRKTVAKMFGVNTRCSIGSYRLSANPEILQLLYEMGIGSKRSQGNGMFEIIG